MTARQDARVALVTGADEGLGRETARRLGSQGMTVSIGARDPDRGEAAAAERLSTCLIHALCEKS